MASIQPISHPYLVDTNDWYLISSPNITTTPTTSAPSGLTMDRMRQAITAMTTWTVPEDTRPVFHTNYGTSLSITAEALNDIQNNAGAEWSEREEEARDEERRREIQRISDELMGHITNGTVNPFETV